MKKASLYNKWNKHKRRRAAAYFTLILAILLISAGCSPSNSHNQESFKAPSSGVTAEKSQSNSGYSQEEYDKLVADLFSINLIDSLSLSQDQYRQLIPIIEEAEKLNVELEKIKSRDGRELVAALSQIRSLLAKREPITDNEQNRLNKASWEIDKLTTENRTKTQELVKKTRAIFTENQIVMIEEYQPCMTPNRSLCQQDRIGEAKDGWRFQEAVERLRKLPEAQFKSEKEKLIEEEEIRRKAYYNNEQVDYITNQMETAIDKARKMDDNEFEMCKIELAKIDLPSIKAPKGKNVVDEAILRFVLNPGIMDIIKERSKEKN